MASTASHTSRRTAMSRHHACAAATTKPRNGTVRRTAPTSPFGRTSHGSVAVFASPRVVNVVPTSVVAIEVTRCVTMRSGSVKVMTSPTRTPSGAIAWTTMTDPAGTVGSIDPDATTYGVYPAIRMLASASAIASTAPPWSAALFMGLPRRARQLGRGVGDGQILSQRLECVARARRQAEDVGQHVGAAGGDRRRDRDA